MLTLGINNRPLVLLQLIRTKYRSKCFNVSSHTALSDRRFATPKARFGNAAVQACF